MFRPTGFVRGAAVLVAGVACAAVAAAQPSAGPPVVAVAAAGSSGSSDDIFYFSLADGRGARVPRPRDPVELRVDRLGLNLFSTIGRPAGQAAIVGEVLLGPLHWNDGSVRAAAYVETTIGYFAYFEDLGKGGNFGNVIAAIGRPFEELSANDGNFALLMHREGSGRTVGAYLYHATTGRAIYAGDMTKLDPDLKTRSTTPLPVLGGRVAAAALHAGSEGTRGYLIVDPAAGGIFFFDLTSMADQILVRESPLHLYDVFSPQWQVPSSRRFVPVAIDADSRSTLHVLIIDCSTGDMALLENVTDAQAGPNLRKLVPNLDASLPVPPAGTTERVFVAVPNNDSSGRTVGVWIFDHLSATWLYVRNPADPASVTVERVRISG